jgi:extradiol dioxygenase family protein
MSSSSTPLVPFHLAIAVDDIAAARQFYGEVLGFSEGRSDAKWIDWNVRGHQVVTHQVGDKPSADRRDFVAGANPVDGHDVPVPHFGLVLPVDEFQALAAKLEAVDTKFAIAPYVRFAGEPGEQWTMFFFDPAGNALEFKAFANIDLLFAT